MENPNGYEVQQFKKPNPALVLVPKIGNLTTVTRKMFNIILHSTQKQLMDLKVAGKLMAPDEGSPVFTARLDELTRPVQTTDSQITTYAKKALTQMRDVRIDWNAPDANSEVIWSDVSLLSEASITKVKGILYANWVVPNALLKLIRDPDRFTVLDNAIICDLSSYAAVALYEICARYKDNPSGVTSQNELEWWVDALTQSPKVDPKTKKVRLRPWTKFKNEHGNAAIAEINEKTDIGIELIEKKGTGKTIVAAQFKVWRKSVQTIAESKIKMSPEIADLASNLGFDLSSISLLLNQGLSEVVVLDGLRKFKIRTEISTEPIDSKMAYLRKILSKTSGLVASSIPKTASGNPAVPISAAAIEMARTYKEERRAAIRAELLNLSKEDQKVYATQVLDELKVNGQSNPTIFRKVECGEWSTAHILFNKMIERFAVEQYGADWAIEQPVN